jgi:hypothetical protein
VPADASVVARDGLFIGEAVGDVMLIGSLERGDNMPVAQERASQPEHVFRIRAVTMQRNDEQWVAIQDRRNVK